MSLHDRTSVYVEQVIVLRNIPPGMHSASTAPLCFLGPWKGLRDRKPHMWILRGMDV